MISRFVVGPEAEADIDIALDWTRIHFGIEVERRYEALMKQALRDVADDPFRLGSVQWPEVLAGVRVYHLSHSRNRVPPETGRIKKPRHFLLYRVRKNGMVDIGRVLHEAMDISRHLPDSLMP